MIEGLRILSILIAANAIIKVSFLLGAYELFKFMDLIIQFRVINKE